MGRLANRWNLNHHQIVNGHGAGSPNGRGCEHDRGRATLVHVVNSIHQRILRAREVLNGQALPGHTRPSTVASEQFA